MPDFWAIRSQQRDREAQAASFRNQAQALASRVLGQDQAAFDAFAQQNRNQVADRMRSQFQTQAQAEDEKHDGGLFGGLKKIGAGTMTALGAVGDVLSRPNYASAAFTDAAINTFQGKDDNPFVAAWEGFSGRRKITYGDVLAKHGVENPWVRGIAGFGLDILLDPTTYVTFGGVGAGREAAAKIFGRAVLEDGTTLALSQKGSRGVMTALRTAGLTVDDEAGQDLARRLIAANPGYLEKGGIGISTPFVGKVGTLVPGKTFTPLAGLQKAIGATAPVQAVNESLGRMFVRGWAVKQLPSGDQFMERLANLERYPEIARTQAGQTVMAHFGNLDPTQRKQLFWLAQTDLQETSPQDIRSFFQSVGVAPPDLTTGQGIGMIQDTGLRDALSWYSGTLRPEMDALAQEVGVTTMLPNYMRALYPHEKGWQQLTFLKKPIKMRASVSAQQREYRTAEEWLQHGRIQDPRLSVAAEIAEKKTVKETNDFVKWAADNYMTKLGKNDVLPDGMVEFTPRGRLAQLRGVGQTVGERYAAPPEIAEAMYRFFDPKEMPAALRAYDWVQGIWKATVTSIFPEFHVRNAFGNFYNNWLGGVGNPGDYATAAKLQSGKFDHEIVHTIEGDVSLGDLRQKLMEMGLGKGGSIYGEIAHEGRTAMADFDNLGKKHSVIRYANPFAAGRTAGQAIENNAQYAHVLGKLSQGMTLQDATLSAKKAIFDYSDLSDFEKQVMRRAIPFYTFMRKNVPLQLESMVRQPGKPAAIFKALGEAGAAAGGLSAAEQALLPQYILEQLNVVVGRDGNGNPMIIRGTGLPIEQVNYLWAGNPKRTLERFAATASPLLTTIPQWWADKSVFTGKDITDPSYQNFYRKTNEITANIPILRDWLKVEEKTIVGADGKEHTVWNADPKRAFILSALVGRMLTTAGQAGRFLPEGEGGKGLGAKVLEALDVTTGLKAGTLNLARTTGRASVERDAIYKEMVDSRTGLDLNDVTKNLLDGLITPEQWRNARTEYMDQRSQKLAELEARWAQEEMRPGLTQAQAQRFRNQLLPPAEAAYQSYISISPDDFIGPDGLPDMQRFYARRDEVLAANPALARSLEQRQDDRLAKLPDPYRSVETEYQQDLELMRGYWDITNREWNLYRQVNPNAAPYDTYADFLAAKQMEIQQSGRLGRVTVESLPDVKGFAGRLKRIRDTYLRRNPEVGALLVKWGYRQKAPTPSAQRLVQTVGAQG